MANDPNTTILGIGNLAAARGIPLITVADATGLSLRFLERVDAGRQPLPKSVVPLIAATLDVSPGTVEAAVQTILEDGTLGQMATRPVPPNPLLGDAFPSNPASKTMQQFRPTAPPAPVVWSTGAFVGGVWLTPSAFARFNRNSLASFAPTVFTSVQYPLTLAVSDTRVFTVGTVPDFGDYYLGAVERFTGSLVYEIALATDSEAPYAIMYEPDFGGLWVSLETKIIRLDPNEPGLITATVPMTHEGNTFRPFGMTFVAGKIYIAACRITGESSSEGRLFEVNGETNTVMRVSTGVDLQGANDVSFDGIDTFYISSGEQVPTELAGLYAVSLSSFVGSVVFMTGGDPTWVFCAFGRIYLSEKAAGVPRLVAFNPNGTFHAEATFIGSGISLGKATSDSIALWVPNPNDGTVSMVSPDDLGILASVEVSGMPHAAAVLVA